MASHRTATAYLQIEGVSPGNGWDSGVRATVRGVTNTKPRVVQPNCIVVKVLVRIPSQAWEPFTAEAAVDIPEELVPSTVDVEAVEL